MSERLLLICAMPGPWPGSTDPDPDGFADAVNSALTVERRAGKGYLGREDIRRHTAASTAIERISRLRGTPAATITARTLDGWPEGEAPLRARAGFHLPAQAGPWLDSLADILDTVVAADYFRRLAAWVTANGYGIVVTPTPTPGADGPTFAARMRVSTPISSAASPDEQAADALRRVKPDLAAFAGSRARRDSARRLWAQLADAVAAGEPIQVGGGARHDVLAEILCQAALTVTAATPGARPSVRVLYVDGSEAQPFPLWSADGRGDPGGALLRVGLMSIRHTDVDLQVDGYWFRNRLVSTARTLAETDAYCAAATTERLRELRATGIGRIELVHTGFEPAAIGFYRGLHSWLAETGERIRVQPLYPLGGLVEGTAWGARAETDGGGGA